MKKILTFCLLLPLVLNLFSQSCLPDGIYFVIQQDIDEFQSNYPGCTEIEGFVELHGSMWNLSGLNVLTNINGNLRIIDCDVIENLAGLDLLKSIGGKLEIFDCNVLNKLSGLENLENIGGNLEIRQNYNLTSLYGMTSLTSVGGQMEIKFNSSLKSFGEFTSLSTISGKLIIDNNSDLFDLSGLANLISIIGKLQITSNKDLSSLFGLDNIEFNSISKILIFYNNVLSECDVKSVCDYIFNEAGFLTTYGNASGCNSQDEIEEACVSAVDEMLSFVELTIHPNPFITSTTIEYTLTSSQTVTITFYNQFGKEVDVVIEKKQSTGLQKTIWAPQNLPDGIYYFRLNSGKESASGKVMLVR